MNPDDNQPANNAPATAPEVNPQPDAAEQNVPLVDAAMPQPVAPTMADTISPDQPASTPPTPAAPVSESPTSQSGVVNATSPITDEKPAQSTTEDPGHTMGVVGLILAIVIPIAGLVVSIIARSKSKKAGHKNGLALAGIIVSIVSMIVSIAIAAAIVVAVGKTVQYCNENGPGTHTTDSGATITCGDDSNN